MKCIFEIILTDLGVEVVPNCILFFVTKSSVLMLYDMYNVKECLGFTRNTVLGTEIMAIRHDSHIQSSILETSIFGFCILDIMLLAKCNSYCWFEDLWKRKQIITVLSQRTNHPKSLKICIYSCTGYLVSCYQYI